MAMHVHSVILLCPVSADRDMGARLLERERVRERAVVMELFLQFTA